jgi:prophage regulatory protein
MTLPYLGAFMMKILSWKQVHELVLYCRQHVYRLEKAKRFPRRVKLGPNRVGWRESEVHEWLRERIEARDESTDDSR